MKEGLVLIDTSAWICFFARRGYPEIKDAVGRMLDENRAAIAGPIWVELIQGCRDESEKRTLERYLQGIHWLSIRDEHWRQAAHLAYDLRRKGITVAVTDTLIAVLTLDHQCTLLHRDRDYHLISKHRPNLSLYAPRKETKI